MADALNDLDQALPASLFERQGYRTAVYRMRELELDRPTTPKHLPAWVEAVKGFVYEVEAVLEAGAILGERLSGERVGTEPQFVTQYCDQIHSSDLGGSPR